MLFHREIEQRAVDELLEIEGASNNTLVKIAQQDEHQESFEKKQSKLSEEENRELKYAYPEFLTVE